MRFSILLVTLFAGLGLAAVAPIARDNSISSDQAARSLHPHLSPRQERRLAARAALTERLTNAERIRRGLPLNPPVVRSPTTEKRNSPSCSVCLTPKTAFCSSGQCTCPSGFKSYDKNKGCVCSTSGYQVSTDPAHCCPQFEPYYYNGKCNFFSPL